MEINQKYSQIASEQVVAETVEALKNKGFDVYVLDYAEEAKKFIEQMIPDGNEIMNMTSMTLSSLSIEEEIKNSGRYISVRKKLEEIDKNNAQQEKEKRCLGAAPDWAIGSVHAVTKKGEILIASATGSQLPAYAYGAKRVVWIIGTQKIVDDLGDGIKRLYEYSFPLEDERARKAYGVGSGVNKILIIDKEVQEDRITIIFIKENIGF